jgi:hypothetical protein
VEILIDWQSFLNYSEARDYGGTTMEGFLIPNVTVAISGIVEQLGRV